MALFTKFVLLAAFSTPIISGPVPHVVRREFQNSFPNTTLTVSSTVEVIQTSSLAGNTILPESAVTPSTSFLVTSSASGTDSPLPGSTGDIAEADTALVVEPIQQTVVTHIIPGITFHNPEGVPVITDEPQTILSTIYITPTPAPKLEETSSTSPTPSATPSPEVAPTQSNNIPIASESLPADVSSSVAAVENGTATETSQQGPMFTYSPKEETSATPVASPTQDLISNSTTAAGIAPTSGGMPGFNHPGSASRGVLPTEVAPNSTIAASSTLIVAESSGQPTIPAPSASDSLVDDTESTTHVYVTKTEYTTVYPSSTPSVLNTTTIEPAAPTDAQNTPAPSAQPLESAAASSNSAAALPTTSLQPPVVIITQYTTVTPAPEAEPTEAPAPSSAVQPAPSVAPSAPYENPGTSAAAEPTATPPAATSTFAPAPSSEIQAPPSATPSPPAETSPSTTEAIPPPPEPTSTTEGPLIITPIPPSQIFTVTVTETEKETVTETATVTVPARR